MILTEDDVKKIKGFSDEEALKLLKSDGYNELPTGEKRNILKIITEVFKEPMFFLLIASSALYLFLGSVDEALILLGSVFLILAVYASFLRKIFYFELLAPLDIVISLAAGILSIVWFEIIKKIYTKKGMELLGD